MLIRGESGTGKELLAAAIHQSSPRAGRPFVKLHCAALSQSLLESELFGHVKSAFTGADRDRVGRFEQANGGTLFLDEIGDINLEVQTKLLRVLQEMSFERVGSSQPITVDVRILAATHQDLEALIRAGRFREDLYYRLNVICLHTPALRERREDIFELAVYFLNVHSQRTGKLVTHLDPEAVEALVAYDWPGNIRELENVLERAVVLADGPAVMLDDLPPELRQPGRRRLRPRLPATVASACGRDACRPLARQPSDQCRRSLRPRPSPPDLDLGPSESERPGRRLEFRVRRLRAPAAHRRPERSQRQQERGRSAARNAPEHLLQQDEETRDRLKGRDTCSRVRAWKPGCCESSALVSLASFNGLRHECHRRGRVGRLVNILAHRDIDHLGPLSCAALTIRPASGSNARLPFPSWARILAVIFAAGSESPDPPFRSRRAWDLSDLVPGK